MAVKEHFPLIFCPLPLTNLATFLAIFFPEHVILLDDDHFVVVSHYIVILKLSDIKSLLVSNNFTSPYVFLVLFVLSWLAGVCNSNFSLA